MYQSRSQSQSRDRNDEDDQNENSDYHHGLYQEAHGVKIDDLVVGSKLPGEGKRIISGKVEAITDEFREDMGI
jgi:hypothetical protein